MSSPVIMHHIAMDGWSLELLIRELAAFYTAFVEGRAPDVPVLTVQYADFAHWQRLTMTGEVVAKHRDYWIEKLGRSPPTLTLPTIIRHRGSGRSIRLLTSRLLRAPSLMGCERLVSSRGQPFLQYFLLRIQRY